MRRLRKLKREVEMRSGLRRHTQQEYRRGDWYPGALSWDALRSYFCIATGGHRWSEPVADRLLGGLCKRCWKCGCSEHWKTATAVTAATSNTYNIWIREAR